MSTQVTTTDQAGRWHIFGADLAPIRMAGTSILHFLEKFKKKGRQAPHPWR